MESTSTLPLTVRNSSRGYSLFLSPPSQLLNSVCPSSCYISSNYFWSWERGISSSSPHLHKSFPFSGRFEPKPRTSSPMFSALYSFNDGFLYFCYCMGHPPSYFLYWDGPWAFPWSLLPEVYLSTGRSGVLPSWFHTISSRVHDNAIWCTSVRRNPGTIPT